jgi:hypothetical protein
MWCHYYTEPPIFCQSPILFVQWAIVARFGYAEAGRFPQTNESFYNEVWLGLEHVNAR